MPTAFLAIDLGASSGRAIVGVLDGQPLKVTLEEVHRFDHHPCPTPAGPVWDLTGIWLNVLTGLKAAVGWCAEQDIELTSVGVDAWGVDWTLVGRSGEVLALPHCYRDPQNEPACERVLEIVGGRQALYARNGIQLMPINSLFQVAARYDKEPGLFEAADRLVFIPDLIHFWLSGNVTTERTIASTSSMLDLTTGDWDLELVRQLGIPEKILGPLTDPGTVIGHVREELARDSGADCSTEVIAPGSHDTASAVAAVPHLKPPGGGDNSTGSTSNSTSTWAYLSSGTWSLLGVELNDSFASPAACEAPFTNELGLAGTTRFLKNIAGLWLVQEVRRQRMQLGEDVTFEELTDQARTAVPYRTLIDPNAIQFAAPGKMAEKIREFARETQQPEPETLGDLVRCCLDSLALCYRHTVDLLESVLGLRVDTLHIVGGGTNNKLLNQITAATMQRPVICGPVEATAMGNVLTQAMGSGHLSGLEEIREVVARSVALESYLPEELDSSLDVPESTFEFYRKLVDS